MTHAFDPATQKIIDDFDAYVKKRAAELLTRAESAPLQSLRELSFCFGYKAGVIDSSAAQRAQAVADVTQMAAVFAAACAWRDSPAVDRRFLAGTPDLPEERLIAVIDAARAARKDGAL